MNYTTMSKPTMSNMNKNYTTISNTTVSNILNKIVGKEVSNAELFKNLYYSMIMYQLFPTNFNSRKVTTSDVKNLVVLHDQSDLPAVDDVEIVNFAIFRDDIIKRYYLAFRGSSTQNDWFINANTAPVDALYGNIEGPCYVFCGYHSIIQNTYSTICNYLKMILVIK